VLQIHPKNREEWLTFDMMQKTMDGWMDGWMVRF